MAQLRTLTVNLVDLNLQTDVINGASVEISLERTATSDSFAIVPTLSYSKTSDATGILTFRILPNNDYTRYRAKVVATSGQQVLDAFFVMPDGNRALATLLQLSVYPDGFNNTVVTTGYATQFQVNGEDVGTPDLVETLNIDMPGATKTDPDITGAASVHLPYSGQFRGTWDMSSGSTGPAAPASDYQATHTGTTITPDSHLTSSGTMYIAGSQSPTIPLLTSGVAQASITKSPYTAGDNIFGYYLFLSDANLTLEQLEAAGNGAPLPAGTRFISIAINHGGSQSATISAYNNGITGSANATGFTSGNAYLRYDYATGDAVMVINGISYGPVNLPFVSGMKLTAVIHCTSPDVVFGAGHISVNFSDTTDVIPSAGLPVDDLFDFSADLVGGTYTLTPSPYGAVYHAVATTTSTDYAGGWCATENRYNGDNPLYTYFGFCNVEMTASDIDDIFSWATPGTFALLIYAHTDTDNDVYYGGRGPGGWLSGSATDGKQHPDGGLVYFRCRDDGAGSFVLEIRVDGVVTTLLTASNSGISGMKPFIYANYVYGTQTIGQVFFAG